MGSPVYIQIHNQIKKDIEAGVWAVGDRIPSERELALEFNVSRMTLRQAGSDFGRRRNLGAPSRCRNLCCT